MTASGARSLDDEAIEGDPERLLATARGRFAECAAAPAGVATMLGSIRLRADQIETAQRVSEHVVRDGGCLLADDVGTGKTFVALAVARAWTRPLVVIPASLRTTWERAARDAAVSCAFASHESLSRGRLPREPYDGLVVDESHRFRPTSRRHAALARLAARAPLLMLSATPLQNRTRELAGQLALFLGEVAFRLDASALARWVVRSAHVVVPALPRVAPPRWIPLDADDAPVLRAILALPPPPRAIDAGDGGVLLQLSLVRAWASSRSALAAALGRRIRTLVALEQCQHEGRSPTRRELRSWTAGDDVQLGFPTLLAASLADRERASLVEEALRRERAALDRLAATIALAGDVDGARVRALRALRAAHPNRAVLAFTEWASTARAYWTALRADPMVGLLTASEARIASGRIGRDELLARFAPVAQRVTAPHARERVTLLLATDLLSEGVNLQDASVVVHLDLPWNPARLAQRLGRVRRPGGASEVSSYLMQPPARASVLLRTEERLRAKLAGVERIIGRSVDVLPSLAVHGTRASPAGGSHAPTSPLSRAELRGDIAQRLARWRGARGPVPRSEGCVVARARSELAGWVAALGDGRVVAMLDDAGDTCAVSEEPEVVARALRLADGIAGVASTAEVCRARAALETWISRDWSRRSCGLDVELGPLRRRVLRMLDDAVLAAPRHHRARSLELAAVLRRAIAFPLPLGLERELDALAREPLDVGWLERAEMLVRGSLHARGVARDDPARPRAIILLGDEPWGRRP